MPQGLRALERQHGIRYSTLDLNARELARYAYAAGFRGESLVLAVAIALGESGGSTGAEGDTTIQTSKWGPSLGLWQIRSLKGERGTGRWRDPARLKDPMFNARAAFAISNGGSNFKPWTVFTKGFYRKHLATARAAIQGIGEATDFGDFPELEISEGDFDPSFAVASEVEVRDLYQRLMGRAPTDAEMTQWTGRGLGDVSAAIHSSDEARIFYGSQLVQGFSERARDDADRSRRALGGV